MGLADYKPERREIVAGDTSFQVGALSFATIATIVKVHLPDIEALYKLFKERGHDLSEGEFESLVMSIVSEAPGLGANLIALAAGESDATEHAAKLPIGVQIEALTTIAEMTFMEVGGIKKSLEMVANLLGKIKTAKADLTKTPTLVKVM